MGFDRAQATSNANSKVLRIRRIVEQVGRPSTEQMALIAAIVEEYETGVPEWARESNPRPEYPASTSSHDPECPHAEPGTDPDVVCACLPTAEEAHEEQDANVSDSDPAWPHHDDEVPC